MGKIVHLVFQIIYFIIFFSKMYQNSIDYLETIAFIYNTFSLKPPPNLSQVPNPLDLKGPNPLTLANCPQIQYF
jgi:hypothetical protein